MGISSTVYFLMVALFAPLSQVSGSNVNGNNELPFLWGTATAAYQVEGAAYEDGRGKSIWDTFSHTPGKVFNDDNGDIADDSYHKYLEDIRLMRRMGVKAHRFSISWSRIYPSGHGYINWLGVNFYNKFIDELILNGIQPMVTLYHWDLPDNLEREYEGWLGSKVISDFTAYTDFCFATFGDRVKYWITINEPWTFIYLGYVAGTFAPGRCSDRTKCMQGNSSTEGYLAAHNVLLAHASSVQLYRKKYQRIQKGVISIVLNHDFSEPLTNDPLDVAAAERKNVFSMGWFGDPVIFGRYPPLMEDLVGDRLPRFSPTEAALIRGSVDYWAMNHYSTKYVSHVDTPLVIAAHTGGWAVDMNVTESKYSYSGTLIGLQGDSPWLNLVPWGFYKALRWSHDRYARAYSEDQGGRSFKIYVTENGCDVPNESGLLLSEALNDTFRIDYYRAYIGQLERAMSDGLDIRGYMAWSLLDNFEWADGYGYRFGLHYVDYNTPERTRYPKASAGWYGGYIHEHTLYSRGADGRIIARSAETGEKLCYVPHGCNSGDDGTTPWGDITQLLAQQQDEEESSLTSGDLNENDEVESEVAHANRAKEVETEKVYDELVLQAEAPGDASEIDQSLLSWIWTVFTGTGVNGIPKHKHLKRLRM